MGRDTWDARCLADGARADAVELLPCLRTQRLYLGVVKPLGDEDVLQTLELLGLLTLTLDIAAVLDEDLGTLGDLLTARRDDLDGTSEGGHHLAEVGERQLGAQDEINELTALTERSEPTRLELRIDLVGADGVG